MRAARRRASLEGSRALPAVALVLVALSLVTGLLFFPASFVFPYVTPKVLFLRSVAVMLAGLLLLAAPGLRPRPTPITLAVAAFLLSALLSTLTSIDRHRSLWDTHERMLGVFTLAHYGVLYLAATTLVRDRRSWLLLLRVFLAVSALIVVLGVAQKIFPQFLYDQDSARVASTLGHPIYLGGLGVTMVFAGCLRWGLGGQAKGLEAAFAGLLGVVGVTITASRGSVVALGMGLWVLGIGYLAVLPARARRLRTFAIVAALSGLAVLVLRPFPGWEAVPGLGRFAGITLGSYGVRTRILAWAIALDAFQERPLLGWGPANFYYAFNRWYRPELLEFGWGETWFDSAHNASLDALVQQGILGLVAYLALLATPPVLLWRAYRRGQQAPQLPCVATALLVAHFVQQCFAFEQPTSLVSLAFFLAYFNRSLEGFEEESAASWPRIRAPAAAAIAVAAVSVIWVTDIEPGRANQAGRAAVLAARDGEPREARAAYGRYVAFAPPHVDGVRELFALAVIERFNRPDARRSAAHHDLGRFAYDELGKALDRHPHDVRLALHRARLAQLLAKNFGDSEPLRVSEAELVAAFEDSPHRQEIRFLLSTTKLLLGKPPREAILLLEAAIGAAPRVGEGWWRLALVYSSTGQKKQARQVLEDARARDVHFLPSEEQRVREILASAEE